jgi:hypothetical protein
MIPHCNLSAFRGKTIVEISIPFAIHCEAYVKKELWSSTANVMVMNIDTIPSGAYASIESCRPAIGGGRRIVFSCRKHD